MATVNASIALAPAAFPAGSQASNGILYQLLKAGVAAPVATKTVYLPALTTTFPNIAAGNYTVQAQRMTPTGQVLGGMAVSPSFTVPEEDIMIDVVASVAAGV